MREADIQSRLLTEARTELAAANEQLRDQAEELLNASIDNRDLEAQLAAANSLMAQLSVALETALYVLDNNPKGNPRLTDECYANAKALIAKVKEGAVSDCGQGLQMATYGQDGLRREIASLKEQLAAAISAKEMVERERDAFVNILTDDRNVVSAIVKLQQWAKEQAK